MRTVAQLISDRHDAWPQVLAWVEQAVRSVDVLPIDPASRGESTLFALQVTTRSLMGAIALRSGGIVVDNGWIRILGAGHERIGGGLREWNALDGNEPLDPPLVDALIVAYDALGGFFALNGGAWPGTLGQVHYFPPDTHERQATELTYSGFLDFVFAGDLDAFYAGLRWPGWREEVGNLGPDEAMSIYPFLGFEQAPIGSRSRKPVLARGLWNLYRSMDQQLRGLPDGSAVRVQLTDMPASDINER